MNSIKIADIKVTDYQRATLKPTIDIIVDSIKDHGYNSAYPIIIDMEGFLVDGGHRMAAAKQCQLSELPYIIKPDDGTSNLRYAMQCNDDRGRGRADDVFDKAEYCWKMANVGGMTGQEIADELGWSETASVTNYKNIKANLHPDAWELARNPNLANLTLDPLANQELAIANWKESHFRAFLKHLPCPHPYDYNTLVAQLKVIEEVYTYPKKLSAKWIDKQSARFAWYLSLTSMVDNLLIPEVDSSERQKLIKFIEDGVFGDKSDDKLLDKLVKAISALNEKILGIKLYQDDCFQFIPTLKDKSIALVVTDIPYNTTDNDWDKIGDEKEYIQWVQNWLNILKPKLCDDYHIFFCVAPEYVARIECMMVDDEWPLKVPNHIWEYRNLVKGRVVADKFIGNYQVVFHIGTHNLNWTKDWNDERFAVQNHACPQTNFNDKKLHPTSKPLDLFELYVRVGSKPGDIILDPFAGGGTTGEASKNIGQRQCILIEQSEKYCEVIQRRLNVIAK